MTTAAVKPVAIRKPPTTARSRRRVGGRHALALAMVVVTLAAVGAGTWLLVERFGSSSASALSAPMAAPATPAAMPMVERFQIIGLQRQLVRAGYAIKVDGTLDRVAQSALADYLRPNEAHPLSALVASALGGTVITGLRDPSVWNRRFGPQPRTLVELAP